MTHFISLVLCLAFVAASFAQETLEERFVVLDRNEAAVRANAKRSLENKTVSIKTHERTATLNCNDPRMVAVRDGLVRMLCDVNEDGVADAVSVFYQLPPDAGYYISALATNRNGNLLFAASETGTYFTLTDGNRNGLADPQVTRQNPGLAYTEKLIAHFDSTSLSVYAENSDTGRFNLYFLNSQETRVQGGSPAKGARRVAGSVGVQNVGVYFIDPMENSVRLLAYNGVGYLQNESSRNDLLYRGRRVSSIAVDQAAGLLFVLEAGNCGDVSQVPQLPGVPTPNFACSAPGIHILKLSGNAAVEIGVVNDPKLTATYALTAHPMVARGGKLHLSVYAGPHNERGSAGQEILEFRYNQATGKIAGPATVFADYQLLGDNPFVGAISTFDGGPAMLPQ